MSHKKTIKLVKLKPKALAKSVFKSKTLKVADDNDATQIAAAVRKAAVEKAERALLDDELAKPSAARNPALMRKYGTVDTAGAVDAYPDLDKGGKFHIVATVPDDPDIPLEHRPTPWSVTIIINNDGNQFDFVFPFSRAVGVPAAVFKLDRLPVYLDADHNVIIGLSPEYSIYEALLDYKTGDPTYADDGKAMFEELGVLKDDKFDFRIRGLGWLVKSTRLKTTTPTTTKSIKEPGELKVVRVNVQDDVEYENNEVVARKLEAAIREGGSFPLLGLSPTDKLKSRVYVDKIYASSRLGQPIIVLDDVVEGNVWAIAISGPASVEKLLNKKKLSTASMEAWVVAQNRKVLAKFKASSE
jgi:hypothetical protein